VIKVKNIDFNPMPGAGAVDATVNEGTFYAAVLAAIKQASALKSFVNQSGNVVNEVQTKSYEGKDVEELSSKIAEALKTEYGKKGLAGWSETLTSQLTDLVRKSVVDSLTPTQMDKGEQAAFDKLVSTIGEANMSRRKGAPTPIPLTSLPPQVAEDVKGCRQDLYDERHRWNRGQLNLDTMNVVYLSSTASTRLKENGRYQGNHTNNAGWLPVVIVAPNPIAAMRQSIVDKASPALHAELTQPNPMQRLAANRANQREYEKLLAQAVAGYSDPDLGDLAIAAMGFGVSAYIEFNLTTMISRLMYDFVNKKFYLTAHYRWKDGYNPFFEVTGVPAL
jgi:hypothetical protein